MNVQEKWYLYHDGRSTQLTLTPKIFHTLSIPRNPSYSKREEEREILSFLFSFSLRFFFQVKGQPFSPVIRLLYRISLKNNETKICNPPVTITWNFWVKRWTFNRFLFQFPFQQHYNHQSSNYAISFSLCWSFFLSLSLSQVDHWCDGKKTKFWLSTLFAFLVVSTLYEWRRSRWREWKSLRLVFYLFLVFFVSSLLSRSIDSTTT